MGAGAQSFHSLSRRERLYMFTVKRKFSIYFLYRQFTDVVNFYSAIQESSSVQFSRERNSKDLCAKQESFID